MELGEGIGWALFVSGSFFTGLAVWVRHERRRSSEYPGTVKQARRGIAIYGTATLIGLVILLMTR